MSIIGPEWAIPANTALLVVLALIQGYQARKVGRIQKDSKDAKRAAGAVRRDTDTPDTGERRRWDDNS